MQAAEETIAVPRGRTLDELERAAIAQALDDHDWNKQAAAVALGCSVKTVYNKIAKYRLFPDAKRCPACHRPMEPGA